MTIPRRPAPITPAWPQLRALAVAMRPDWDPADAEAAILALETAGWDYTRAARETWRVVWDPAGQPFELRGAVRQAAREAATGTGLTLEERQELKAIVLDACDAASERLRTTPRTTPADPPPGTPPEGPTKENLCQPPSA